MDRERVGVWVGWVSEKKQKQRAKQTKQPRARPPFSASPSHHSSLPACPLAHATPSTSASNWPRAASATAARPRSSHATRASRAATRAAASAECQAGAVVARVARPLATALATASEHARPPPRLVEPPPPPRRPGWRVATSPCSPRARSRRRPRRRPGWRTAGLRARPREWRGWQQRTRERATRPGRTPARSGRARWHRPTIFRRPARRRRGVGWGGVAEGRACGGVGSRPHPLSGSRGRLKTLERQAWPRLGRGRGRQARGAGWGKRGRHLGKGGGFWDVAAKELRPFRHRCTGFGTHPRSRRTTGHASWCRCVEEVR